MRKIDLTSFNVATSETARNINRLIVLDLIRTRQPISRADLARLSGLQRSTISIIVDQLVKEQWVTEGAFGHLPRGRNPRFLHLNVERAGVIGVNVRPPVTTVALANMNVQFIAQESFPTSPDPDEFIETLKKRIKAMIKAHSEIFIEGIGISVPGRVDSESKRLTFAPNLGWRDVDLKTPLESATKLSVEIENAANACALAEIWFEPRTEGIRDLIAVTVSEGIGTGIVSNGQLLRGTKGIAGEFGHMSIVDDGELCKCGNRGCWEMYASNQAVVKEYIKTSSARRSKRDGEPIPTFEDILRLAEQGDSKAIAALEKTAQYLGKGLAILMVGLAPQQIILIGEMTKAWKVIYPIINQILIEKSSSVSGLTQIVHSEDGKQPRLRGSIALILQKHFGAPLIA